MIKSPNSARKVHIATPLLRAKFVKIVRREFGEIVRYLCDQKSKISSPSPYTATAWIAPKLCRGQPPTFGSQSSKFHPNRFIFGGVIAVRVKAIKTRLKVFPILGEAIVSRRVMKHFHASSIENFSKGIVPDEITFIL